MVEMAGRKGREDSMRGGWGKNLVKEVVKCTRIIWPGSGLDFGGKASKLVVCSEEREEYGYGAFSAKCAVAI